MIKLNCDLCGKTLLLDDDVRYVVSIEVYGAYDPPELTEEDLRRDLKKELRELLECMRDMDPEKAQDQVYRRFRFDLCPSCQQEYLKDPLRRGTHDD